MYGAALNDVRKLIYEGPVTQEQRQAGVDFLEDLLQQGFARSAFVLGLQQGYARSAAALAFLILKYPENSKNQQEDALNYYKRGAELGCAVCCFSVGQILCKNYPDGQKSAEVAYCWRVAAALGHPRARFNYAQYLLQGNGVEADPATALKLIEENAEILKQPEAEYKFAYELFSGEHMAKDLPRSYELFKRAAAKGHAAAEINLATSLFNGEGTAVNKPEACTLYKRCADRGNRVNCLKQSISSPVSCLAAYMSLKTYRVLMSFLKGRLQRDMLWQSSLLQGVYITERELLLINRRRVLYIRDAVIAAIEKLSIIML
ncbi:hypothetical protein ELAC_1244 [Estrella lausannensis]|uniref:Uncharacterized protein n=1 Tax=Estrella lausannensis TaxID=483423 RepID=A0A0H5E5U0_9BACT|nr:hypothetical protein ELAC_1244 [Estrella lausannensis]